MNSLYRVPIIWYLEMFSRDEYCNRFNIGSFWHSATKTILFIHFRTLQIWFKAEQLSYVSILFYSSAYTLNSLIVLIITNSNLGHWKRMLILASCYVLIYLFTLRLSLRHWSIYRLYKCIILFTTKTNHVHESMRFVYLLAQCFGKR